MKKHIYFQAVNYLLSLSRLKKTAVIIFADYILLVLILELSLSIRINEIYYQETDKEAYELLLSVGLPIRKKKEKAES